MILPFLSLVLVAASAFDYQPSEKPLNGDELRGFRPIESEEIVMEKLENAWIMVFTGWRNRQTGVYARTGSPENDEWSNPVRISGEAARFDSLPHIWVSSDWVVHCVWQSKGQGNQFSVLYSRRDPASGDWTPPARIEGAGGIRRSPVSVTGDSQRNLFVWSHNRLPGKLLPELQLFASRNDGGAWQRLEPFASLKSEQVSFFDPRLVVTNRDALYLLVLRTQKVTTVLLTSSQDAGGSWTAPIALSENPSPRISDPRLWLSHSLLQATWVDQPEPARPTKRLEAAFLPVEGEEMWIRRLLIQEIQGLRNLHYAVWDDGRRAGVTWLERRKKQRSALRQVVTIVDGKINPGETSTIAESRQSFYFDEFATSLQPGLILVTEKKVVTPSALQACSRKEDETWACEKIHIASGSSDILAPMLIAEESENLYRVIFHEVLFKMHIMQTVLDTTILTGTVTLKRGEGGASDGGGKQGDASSSQFR